MRISPANERICLEREMLSTFDAIRSYRRYVGESALGKSEIRRQSQSDRSSCQNRDEDAGLSLAIGARVEEVSHP